MLSNFFSRINQKWNEFLYGNFCSQIKNLFSDYGHVVANPTKFTDEQPVHTSLQERLKTAKEDHLIFLTFIEYSFDQFVSHLPDENLRKELIEHYKKQILPTLEGNEAEKMNDFIKLYKKAEGVAPDDCPSPDEKLDTSKGKIVEEPSEKMQNANITAHNPKTLFGLIRRLLG